MRHQEPFEQFVQEHHRRLWQALVPVAGSEGASDAVASALAFAWSEWERVSQMENAVGYVYVVAKRNAMNERSAPSFPVPTATDLPDFDPRLVPALLELSEMQRQVVYLVEGFGWGLTDTGRILGISVSTVRNHLARALDRLRNILKVESDA